ncbi:MAG: Rieske 2Fe-2S domain-containing protein [Bacteroidota bacterium]|nr:Rieske 2Fe-2S domain-containing protein [Bacteroidota bacterium]
MTRTEFLKNLGLGSAAIMAVHMMGCETKKSDPAPSTSSTPASNTTTTGNNTSNSGKLDFTLDLSESANSALNNDGGYVISNNVVVAKNGSNYVAVTRVCSHEGNAAITFNSGSKSFVCSVHGAQFDTSGKGLNSFGSKGLKTYSTSLTGTKLRVFEA